MDPIISYSGLEISLVEIILGLALLLLGALIAYVLKPSNDKQLNSTINSMARQQAELQGRLSQFADDSQKRDDLFRSSLDERLAKVSERVGKSITDTQERSSESLKHLHERLALIDRAQKNIEMLSSEVSGLQSILSNKQSRGAFGEIQMQDIIKTLMPPNAYDFQHTLSNGKRVDAIIKMPEGYGDVAIDSKFPMEAWTRLTEAENTPHEANAMKEFSRDLLVHIKAISEKYLIFGETHEVALMFLPSEAIYAEIHARFENVIKKGFMSKVVIVSPSTFMATLHTMRAVMKDAAMREQAHIIQREVGILAQDVTRLDDRVAKLQTHYNQGTEDLRQIRISTDKISSRAGKIEDLELKDNLPDESNVTPIRRVD